MNLRKKRILVTGAGGFIGSHLTEKLLKSSRSVRVFLRYNSRGSRGHIDSFPKDLQDSIEVMWGDLKDPEAIRKAARGVDVLFHLAALIAIPYSYMNPLDYVQTNVVGTTNVLNACLDHNVKVIHTSTSEVYGSALYKPIDEDHPLQGQSPYSASKIAADKIAESYYRSFSLPVSIVRPFNTYGPRQSARAIIPTIITQALSGKVIRLGDTRTTRDFTYVDDTVSGFIAAAQSEDAVGQVINLGSGKDVSIEDIAEKILKILSVNSKIVIDKKRIRPEKSEVQSLCSDYAKAKKLLKWGPRINLDEGLSKTAVWIKENLNQYRGEIYNI